MELLKLKPLLGVFQALFHRLWFGDLFRKLKEAEIDDLKASTERKRIETMVAARQLANSTNRDDENGILSLSMSSRPNDLADEAVGGVSARAVRPPRKRVKERKIISKGRLQ